MGDLREWLSHHSVVYRIFTYSFGDIYRSFEMNYNLRYEDIFILKDKEHNIITEFTPMERFSATDIKDKEVKDGIKISLEVFLKMNEICLKRKIDFLVASIMTKESVYSEYLENNDILEN